MPPIQEFKPDIDFESIQKATEEALGNINMWGEPNVTEEEQIGQETTVYITGTAPENVEAVVLFKHKFDGKDKLSPEKRSHALVGSRGLIDSVKWEVYGPLGHLVDSQGNMPGDSPK